MPFPIDFGYTGARTNWSDAYLAFLFATGGDAAAVGRQPGPLAVADASRYVELFEMQVGLSPLDAGAFAEISGGDNPLETAVKRALEARARGMFPIMIGADRRTTAAHSSDPLVALWGKLGRVETNEGAVLSRHPSVLAGVRAAGAGTFQSMPASLSILTAKAMIDDKDALKRALSDFTDPVHLSIDVDALCPAVAQCSRSLEPGGLGWYDLMGAIEAVFAGPGVVAVDLVGTAGVAPRSSAALLCSQILLKAAGLAAAGLEN